MLQYEEVPPRTATSVAAVSRQVSYQPANDSFTPSNTAVCSPPAAFAMSNSARSLLPQRQVSFSPEVNGMDNPSSTNDVSLTEALQSLATVKQAVVQTLCELKPGKSSSSNSRFPVDKILPYEGKCQLGDCYTSRPAAWCNHSRDKACAFQLDEKLWRQIWDKDEDLALIIRQLHELRFHNMLAGFVRLSRMIIFFLRRRKSLTNVFKNQAHLHQNIADKVLTSYCSRRWYSNCNQHLIRSPIRTLQFCLSISCRSMLRRWKLNW
jgi:hypothetical protein